MKTYFYHHRDGQGKITSTVAFTQIEGKLSRGIATVHPNDNACKATGRRIAEARLKGALAKQGHIRFGRAYHEYHFKFKAVYHVSPTPYERELLAKNNK